MQVYVLHFNMEEEVVDFLRRLEEMQEWEAYEADAISCYVRRDDVSRDQQWNWWFIERHPQHLVYEIPDAEIATECSENKGWPDPEEASLEDFEDRFDPVAELRTLYRIYEVPLDILKKYGPPKRLWPDHLPPWAERG